MKIVFTGGGSGGHFYPIIAVAEEINKIVEEDGLIDVELFLMSSTPYDRKVLFETGIKYEHIPTGKWRHYFSLMNFVDVFKIAFGVLVAIWKMYTIFPDVVFGKGGYGSFPTLMAARFLGIPVIIHESDSIPGKANLFATNFAKRIAISYKESAAYFEQEYKGAASKMALTGVPIRDIVNNKITRGAKEYLKLQEDLPTILIIGGSQGAQRINETVLEILPELVEKYQIIHQVGLKNEQSMRNQADLILEESKYKNRYRMFGYLNGSALAMSAGVATLIVSRAGSTSITEISNWQVPSIVIPIPESVSRDQTNNATAYRKTGACSMIEENNLSPHVLLAEIDRIAENEEIQKEMIENTKIFAKPDAGIVIAREIINIATEHEL